MEGRSPQLQQDRLPQLGNGGWGCRAPPSLLCRSLGLRFIYPSWGYRSCHKAAIDHGRKEDRRPLPFQVGSHRHSALRGCRAWRSGDLNQGTGYLNGAAQLEGVGNLTASCGVTPASPGFSRTCRASGNPQGHHGHGSNPPPPSEHESRPWEVTGFQIVDPGKVGNNLASVGISGFVVDPGPSRPVQTQRSDRAPSATTGLHRLRSAGPRHSVPSSLPLHDAHRIERQRDV